MTSKANKLSGQGNFRVTLAAQTQELMKATYPVSLLALLLSSSLQSHIRQSLRHQSNCQSVGIRHHQWGFLLRGYGIQQSSPCHARQCQNLSRLSGCSRDCDVSLTWGAMSALS